MEKKLIFVLFSQYSSLSERSSSQLFSHPFTLCSRIREVQTPAQCPPSTTPATMSTAAQRYAAASLALSTQKAYASAYDMYKEYCKETRKLCTRDDIISWDPRFYIDTLYMV